MWSIAVVVVTLVVETTGTGGGGMFVLALVDFVPEVVLVFPFVVDGMSESIDICGSGNPKYTRYRSESKSDLSLRRR